MPLITNASNITQSLRSQIGKLVGMCTCELLKRTKFRAYKTDVLTLRKLVKTHAQNEMKIIKSTECTVAVLAWQLNFVQKVFCARNSFG